MNSEHTNNIAALFDSARADRDTGKDPLLASILATASDAIISIGEDQRIVLFNNGAEQIFGYTQDEALGQPIEFLLPPEFRANHPARIEAFAKERGQSRLKDSRSQISGCRKDGTIFPAEASITKAEIDGQMVFTVILRDISARKRVEDQLRLAQNTLDNVGDMVFWIGESGGFEYFNRSGQQSLGYSWDELSAMRIWDVDPRVDAANWPRTWEQLLSRGQHTFETIHRTKDGAEIPVEVTTTSLSFDDRHIVCSFSRDITERKQEQELLRQAQKMEAVGQLTGGVAHDFNNLLAVIAGNAEFLQDAIGDDVHLAAIRRSADRGAELTQRLLAFSRRQTLSPRPVNLHELITSLKELFQRALGEQIKVVVHAPSDTWPILVDPGQLESALLNLAINARDAMPDGGVLEISCANAVLAANDVRFADGVNAGDFVQISVRDTGWGMTETVREHAFEPFYTTKDVGEGSGLGLPMVYGFARQSGGSAVIESGPGEGCEVKLFLPRATAAPKADDATTSTDLPVGHEENVLVLEDDPHVRSFVINALERLNYKVLAIADAAEGRTTLKKNAGEIDLLLSDVVLPGGISGPQFAAEAKKEYPSLKVIFMTGYASDAAMRTDILEIGEAVLTKPFQRADLAKAVHRALTA